MPTVVLDNVVANPSEAYVDTLRLVRGGPGVVMTAGQLVRLQAMGLSLTADGVPLGPHIADGIYSLEKYYGATPSDAQDALQNAVNDIALDKKGGVIELMDAEYDFDSIVWPHVGLDEPPTVIEFRGPFTPATVGFMPGTGLTLAQGGDVPAPNRGAILNASLDSGSAFGGLVATSNILPVFTNVIVRCPPNPQWHGIDCGWAINASLHNVVVDQGRSWGDGSNPNSPGPIVQPTNAGVVGVIMPGEGNGGVSRARDVLIAGNYTALRHSEHFDFDNLTIGKCIVGLGPSNGWHASRGGRLSLYWNKIGIQPNPLVPGAKPITPIHIAQMDTEEDPIGTNWYSTDYHVNDPSNQLRGEINLRRMVPAGGPSPVLKRYGGAYLHVKSLSTPPKAVYDVVGFGGADSATALPNSLVGQTPTQHRGTWGVSSKRAYVATRSNTTAGDFAVWETGQTQVALHSRITVPNPVTTMNMGLALCTIDNANTLMVLLQAGTVSIQKIDAGVYTNLSGNLSVAMVAGQEIDLRAIITGKTIRVYFDGTLVRTYTLTAAEATKYFASTSHGLFAYTSGAAGEQGGASGGRWGFLRIESPGPMLA